MESIKDISIVGKPEVSAALTMRYSKTASQHGSMAARKDIAATRRMMSSLRNSFSLFDHRSEEERANVSETIRLLESVVQELIVVSSWSEEFFEFCSKNAHQNLLAQINKFCEIRWGANFRRQQFEVNLVHELRTKQGLGEMLQWFQSCGILLDVKPIHFISLFLDEEELKTKDTVLNAAYFLLKAEGNEQQQVTGKKDLRYTFGWAEYNNYLEHRWKAAREYEQFLKSTKTI